MSKRAIFLLLALSACSNHAAAPKAPDAVAIRAALDQQVAKFMPLMSAKDAAGIAALFTDDATWILPDATTFTGKAAITAGAKSFFDGLDSFTAETASIDKLVIVNDSEAVTFSHGIGMMKVKGGKKAERHNNPFADYWTKGADGIWRIGYEINSDGVVAEPAAPKKP